MSMFSAIDAHTSLCESTCRTSMNIHEIDSRRNYVEALICKRMYEKAGIDVPQSVTLGNGIRFANVLNALEISDKKEVLSVNEKSMVDYIESEEGQTDALYTLIEVVDEENRNISEAQTVFVSSSILEEVCEATETMPDNTLIPQDIFIPNGLLVFESPLTYEMEIKEADMVETWNIRYVQFNVGKNGDGIDVRLYGNSVHMYASSTNSFISYSDKLGKAVFTNADTGEETDAAEVILGEVLPKKYEEKMSYMYERIRSKSKNVNTFIDATFFPFGDDIEHLESFSKLKKQLIALFRMTYSYLDVENHKPPRPFVRRAKRSTRKIPDDFYLTVLTLRHKNYEGGTGEKHASPRFAFRVRGHWAKRYLRSTGLPVGDPKAYRFVYISDYIKGKDKPLIESRRLVAIKN